MSCTTTSRRTQGRQAGRQAGRQSPATAQHRPPGKCKRRANANANANVNANANANANVNLASQKGGQQRTAIVSDRTGHRNVRELGGERSQRARLAGGCKGNRKLVAT
jgi:hypothetical protein